MGKSWEANRQGIQYIEVRPDDHIVITQIYQRHIRVKNEQISMIALDIIGV